MTKEDLQKAIAGYKGEITKIKECVRTLDPKLRYCRCGCEGSYTDHTMRLGERGIR